MWRTPFSIISWYRPLISPTAHLSTCAASLGWVTTGWYRWGIPS